MKGCVQTEVSHYGTKQIDIHYGGDSEQTGDFYMPYAEVKGTVCLFHGGFWKVDYNRHQLDSICQLLLAKGYAVWNVEYRRTGVPNRQWQDPFEDTVAAVNFLSQLAADSTYQGRIDLNKIAVVGHSAGGHLAVWLGNHRHAITSNKLQIQPRVFIGLAPVLDLHQCFESNAGDGAVIALLQATPDSHPSRYQQTSPMMLDGIKANTVLIHGVVDGYLPIQISRQFFDKFYQPGEQLSGANLAMQEIKGGDHMDFLDPCSRSTSALVEVLEQYSAVTN